MAPGHPSQRAAATRGSLSARQRQDICWAARVARKEGVTIVLPSGAKIVGGEPAAAGNQQQQELRGARQDAGGSQSTATDDAAVSTDCGRAGLVLSPLYLETLLDKCPR